MTEKSEMRLRDLLPDNVQMESTVKEALDKEPGIGATRLAWGVIGSEATGALKSVLDLDVFDVVAQGWCVAKELHEYTDRSKHPSGERSVVYLGQHTFVQSVYPILTITIGSFKSVPLRFTLELAANIRGAALAVCNGYITSVGSGDGDVSAQLKYGSINLNKQQSKKVPFPAHVEFTTPGLPIV
jgi:hypothetical protein